MDDTPVEKTSPAVGKEVVREILMEVLEDNFGKSLYTTTFLAYGGGAKMCPDCLMADH